MINSNSNILCFKSYLNVFKWVAIRMQGVYALVWVRHFLFLLIFVHELFYQFG